MRKLATKGEIAVGLVFLGFVGIGTAWAAIPSFRAASLRLTGASAAGTAGTAANPVIWADTTTQPNLRMGDGTADRYVVACSPTTNGDVCSWNGTNWVRSAGGGGSTLQAAYTAGGAGGGAIALTSSGGPIACTTGADSNSGVTVKANSSSQSADLFESFDSSGNPRFEITPVDSGGTHRLVLTSNVNGSPVVLSFVNSLLSATTQWVQGSVTQLALGGSKLQIFGAGFSTQYAQIDANGLESKSGLAANYRSAASTVTVAVTDHFVGVSGSGSRTVNLPAANTCSQAGQEIIIQDIGNSAGTITINRASTDLINGATTATIAAAYGAKVLICDASSNWWAR